VLADFKTIGATAAATYGVQVAAALSDAHARGLVDGDLRPESMILMGEDDVKLAGLAAPDTADAIVLPQDAPPAAGHFLSPEQAKGGAATHQSDLYALGAILYTLTTGAVPFDAETGTEVAAMQVNNVPESPRRVNPEVPASMETVIMKAMEKDPAMRYASAEEMRQDLERIAAGADVAPAVVAPAPAKKRSAWPWVLLILALIAAAIGLFWFLSRGDIEVPDLAGQTVDEATVTLTDAQLVLGEVTYNENYPDGVSEGTIFQQDPEAGKMVDASATVDVVVAGSELSEVPDVTGMTEAEAVVAIRDAGFDLGGTESDFSAEFDAGTVYDQNPKGGTEAPVGAPITIFVSKGVETVNVPNVVGMSESQAVSALEDAGLQSNSTQAFSDKPIGEVIDQNPSAGVNVDAGTTVQLTISQGQETVSVPNVVGMSENAATEALEDAGLRTRVEYEDNAAQAGKVIRQDPAAATTVDPGTRVTITVGQEPAGP
jgi:serine/threonine-protein kinase